MATFLSNQLDFIFFFYGLAFVLLGVICRAIYQRSHHPAWGMMAAFGFVHGAGEWLDLTALVAGDTPQFSAGRVVVMIASFMLLMDYGRLECARIGAWVPGRWIYVALAGALAFIGFAYGIQAAGIAGRYLVGFPGALAASFVMAHRAGGRSGAPRWLSASASIGFAAYALAAGLVVPSAGFWPASAINYQSFADTAGIPVQLVRALLACWLSFVIWAIWGQKVAAELDSQTYASYSRRQFVWTLAAMTGILVSGWALTEYLGNIYRNNVRYEANGDLDLLASRLSGETSMIDSMSKALAGSPSVMNFVAKRGEAEPAGRVLRLHVDASKAERGYILDRAGHVLAASGPHAAPDGFAATSYFRSALEGGDGAEFELDATSRELNYFAAHPIRGAAGQIAGVAVLTTSLDDFEADLVRFNRPYFLVDPDGKIMLTNRPSDRFRQLWPLSGRSVHLQSGQSAPPLMSEPIADDSWTEVDGDRNYVRRRFVGAGNWSLVILKPTREMFASRMLGIVITFLVTLMVLVYILGKERWIQDSIRMRDRLKLQELAQDLRIKATTDPLTGLYNRLKLHQVLADEIKKAERYNIPVSVVLYDIDSFKNVNDTYGHSAGDRVLVQLSRSIRDMLRSNDFIARWGGEEFLVLLPGADAAKARDTAEKIRRHVEDQVFDAVGSVTCSFGVAQLAAHETIADLVSRADEALYRAKAKGRNRVELADGEPGSSDQAISAA